MPSAQFQQSIARNLNYWLESTRELDEASIRLLDSDHLNILRAVQFGSRLMETRRKAGQLILQVFKLIERRGYWRQWISLTASVSNNLSELDDELHLKLLDVLGQFYRLNRQWDEAIAVHKEGEALARLMGQQEELAKSHLRQSQVYWNIRDYHQCENYAASALATFEKLPVENLELIGAVTTILGLSYSGRGEHDQAEKQLFNAVDIYRKLDEPALLARSMMNLALTLETSGKGDAALELYEDAQVILEPTEHELDKLRVELSLGTLHINAGRLPEAEAAFTRADSAYLRQSGLVYYQALTANNLGNTYMEMGRLEEAERYLRESISLWEIAGGSLMLANTMGTLAEVLMRREELQTAVHFYREALAITALYPDDAWGRRLHKKFQSAVGELDQQMVAMPGKN